KKHLLELYAVPAHRWQRIGELHLNRKPVPPELVVYQGQNTPSGTVYYNLSLAPCASSRSSPRDCAIIGNVEWIVPGPNQVNGQRNRATIVPGLRAVTIF